MRKIACCFVGAVLVTVLSGVNAAQAPLAGTYRLEGKNPDGKAYTGLVSIQASGRVWQLRWESADAEAVGYGLLRDKILSVVFQTSDGAIGVASYTLTGGLGKRRLTGQWFYPPTDFIGTETLIETKDIPASAPPPRRPPTHPQIGV